MYAGTEFAIATESYLATRAGYEAYKAGGNAADAAACASIVLTYTLPHLGGVGGDFLALIHRGSGVEAVLGLGWAPRRVPEKPPRRGIQSAVVPGYLAGLYELHRRYGSLTWEKVVDIALGAMEKATLHPSLAYALEKYRDILLADPGGRIYLSLPGHAGEPYRIEPLLRLWRRLRDNPLSFYDEVAADLLHGYFEIDDFSRFRAEVRRPLSLAVGEWTVYEAPPPSLGFAVLLALKLTQRAEGAFSYARIRDVVSALKKAHWARDRYLHDGDVPIGDILEGRVELGEAESPEPTPGTTYLAAADRELVVSAIQSLYYPFGAGYTDAAWGVTFNNRASDFTAGLNRAAPHKRPAHTLSAVVLEGEGGVYALGASAGHYRPAIYVQLVQNIVWYGMDLRAAVWAPRFMWRGGDEVQAEEGWETGPGVQLVKYPSRMGVAAAAARKGPTVAAVADIRGDGLALGL
ncbi:gamma-glutamyltransferase [Pyrobaculum neutrophilum]|uniref:Gamma-glutamyltransferase n=1 Tax=Pyrobaculum neutrophilum (strain DSM 2338 / JCM 9278 / NBRC 100436 / V24Sta) TaxID=444157 RepID=B1Y9L0_PYRNV|nr:gamma-glutamyltransferase [Pyrobaculum neutrophilum]ACB40439.1 Gamma-glutamyltransferase [Pyrobaculum neutrophilum V24Sta]